MSYRIDCGGCHRRHDVEATQAGSSLSCMCGSVVEVPKLSTLRAKAGETPIEQNTIERIRSMIAAEKLPLGNTCPYSSRPADTTIYFAVQCESRWTKAGTSFTDRVAAFLLAIWLHVIIQDSGPVEEHGRDTIVELPVRVADEAWPKIAKLRQKSLKSLLRNTPIYCTLLNEYPEAQVPRVRRYEAETGR